MILVYISLILFISLIITGIITYKGIPESISSIYYKIGWIFTVLLALAAFIIMPYIIDITPENFQFSGFICCMALGFVAVAPEYRKSFTRNVHYTGAVIAALCACIWILFINPWLMLMLLIGLTGNIFNKKNRLFWWEVSCFSMIYTALLIK